MGKKAKNKTKSTERVTPSKSSSDSPLAPKSKTEKQKKGNNNAPDKDSNSNNNVGNKINTTAGESAAASDKRFAAVSSLPIFRSVPRREKKVTIDKRFQSMFSDEKFQANTKVDKRGRKLNINSNDNLVKYYNLDEDAKDADSDEDEEDAEIKEDKEDDGEKEKRDSGSEEDEESSDEDEDDHLIEALGLDLKPQPGIPDDVRKKLRNINIDYARGEAPLLSDEDSSDDDADSSAGEEIDDDVVHEWGELDKDAETTEESTKRLALCNMDWDRLKAEDLMVLFTSFLPPGGRLLKVSIFPSEFGKKRMAEEELRGPLELADNVIKSEPVPNTEYDDKNPAKTNEDDDDENLIEEDDDGDEFQRERLRQYQLNRLKYFYAVMEFDSAGTAEKIYEECDGREYESSAAKIDLRYIPDDMTFDEEEPRDVCDSSVNLKKYHPKFFTTTALQQVKVNCTWDETDPSRKDLIDRVFNKKEQIDDDDLRNYLASSSEESSNEEDEEEIKDQPKAKQTAEKERDAISKYKALLESIGEAEKSKKKADDGLEITWGLGVQEKTKKLVESKLEKDQGKDMTVWEKSLAKKKQEKLAKKKQNEASASEDEETSDNEGEEGGLSMDFEMGPEGEDYVSSEEGENEEDSFKGKKNSKKSKTEKDKQSVDPEVNAELELLLMDEDTNKKHFNMKKILESSNESKSKKKRKLRKQKAKGDVKSSKDVNDDFKIDVEDSRFSALFTSAQYNIDPSEPNFKKTTAMEEIIKEKLKRRQGKEVETNTMKPDEVKQTSKRNRDQELSYLVKSVKRKTLASGKEYSHKIKKPKKSTW